eukprot:251033-Heterocapsa_arctica.AAC.1
MRTEPYGIRCPDCVIGDTGTGIRIVGKDKLADSDLRHLDSNGPSLKLNTANGLTKTQERVTVSSHAGPVSGRSTEDQPQRDKCRAVLHGMSLVV